MKRCGLAGLMLALLLVSCGPAKWTPQERRFFELRSTPMAGWRPNNEYGIYPDRFARTYLRTYKPKIFISPNNFGPVDFYETYLPQTELTDHQGRVVQSFVSRMDLKRYEREAGVSLRLTAKPQFCRGEECRGRKTRAYAALEYDSEDLGEGRVLHFIILTYQFVFPYRGLPAGLSRLQESVASFIGDPEKWVELGLPTTIQVLVPGNGGEPFLVVIGHPTYFRTYLVGQDFAWDPENPKINICFATRSNQAYPCPSGQAKAQVPTAISVQDEADFLFGNGRPKSGLSGNDEVVSEAGGAIPIDYELAHLPSSDPLNAAWISLGNSSRLARWRAELVGMRRSGLNYFNPLPIERAFDVARFFAFSPFDAVGLRLAGEQKASLFDSGYDFNPVIRWNGRNLMSAILERHPLEAFERNSKGNP